MNLQVKIRLGLMMFLNYVIWGAWYVTIGTWLSTARHFTGQQVGLVSGTTAVGAIVAPFFVGLIADKFFATEKLLATLHFVGGLLLFAASRQQSFLAIYSLMLLHCLCYMPTLALTNSLSFRLIRDPKKRFWPYSRDGHHRLDLYRPCGWQAGARSHANAAYAGRGSIHADGRLFADPAAYASTGAR